MDERDNSSRRRADFVSALSSAAREAWRDPEADEQDELSFARMLARAKHRRECHVVGHRGCEKPKTCAKCPHCADERSEGWQRRRNSLRLEGLAWLKAHEAPKEIDMAALAAKVATAVVMALREAGYL